MIYKANIIDKDGNINTVAEASTYLTLWAKVNEIRNDEYNIFAFSEGKLLSIVKTRRTRADVVASQRIIHVREDGKIYFQAFTVPERIAGYALAEREKG